MLGLSAVRGGAVPSPDQNKNKPTKMTSNQLARVRTLLANQRTYLAYMRTVFAIIAVAVQTSSHFLAGSAIVFILVGLYQYWTLSHSIRLHVSPETDVLPRFPFGGRTNVPVAFIAIAAAAIYYYFTKKYGVLPDIDTND